jgi:hypothetical protein
MSSLGTARIDAVQHVIYTRTSTGNADLFINKIKQAPYSNLGTQTNWDATYSLTIANEPSADRPWLGELHLVAIYCRALSDDEIEQNYVEGY